jgi:nitrogen regulatory protein P-II 1
MAKLEIVCKKEDVQEIVKTISMHGGTGETGDGIIYVSQIEQIVKVRTGKEDKQDL